MGVGTHEKNVQTWFEAFLETFNKHYLPLNEWQNNCLLVEVVHFLSMEGQL